MPKELLEDSEDVIILKEGTGKFIDQESDSDAD